MQHVFIDPVWVANEYLKRCQAKAWDKNKTDEALKFFNLERILTADQYGLELSDEYTIGEYISELNLLEDEVHKAAI